MSHGILIFGPYGDNFQISVYHPELLRVFFICLSKLPGTFRVWCHILKSTPMQAKSSEGLISKLYPICFIFENLLKTFETIKKVLSCLKIPPTCMRFDHFANCENIVPQFQTPLILAAPLPPSPLPARPIPHPVFIIVKGWKINYQELHCQARVNLYIVSA